MPPFYQSEGFSRIAPGELFSWVGHGNPLAYYEVFEDFNVAAPATQGWTLTQTNGTFATAAGSIGALTLGGADNDLAQLYGTIATLALVAGKRATFAARVKVDKATGTIGEEELFFGLTGVQTGTNFFAADGLSRTFDDGVGFASYDGSANIDCIAVKDDVVSTEAAAATYADVTFMVLAFHYDGSVVKFYKDGNLIAEMSTNIPTDALTPMLYIKAGEAKAKVLSIDYVRCVIER